MDLARESFRTLLNASLHEALHDTQSGVAGVGDGDGDSIASINALIHICEDVLHRYTTSCHMHTFALVIPSYT